VIVESKPGDELSRSIYEKLKSSTVGIILVTADIEDEAKNLLSRPNIYHEIGYLMAIFSSKKHGKNKVIPVLQTIYDIHKNKKRARTVMHPSNISDLTRIPLKNNEIEAIYPLIIRTLSDLLTSISVKALCRALYSHQSRIYDSLEANQLEPEYARNCLRKIKIEMDNLRHDECTFYPCTKFQRSERIVTDYDVTIKK
jgi:hypothetical protein